MNRHDLDGLHFMRMATARTLGFALFGVGRFGEHYLRLFQHIPGVELRAVVTKGNKINPAAVFRRSDIDCIVIATPASTHFALARAAIKAGKHVLIEKPVTETPREAKVLIRLVKQSRRCFMVGYQLTYNDYVRVLKREVGRGTFGKILLVASTHLSMGPIRSDTGSFVDAGCHGIALARYLLGPLRVKRVRGASIAMGNKKLDDFASASIEFRNGIVMNVTTSWFFPEKVRRFVLVGSKATAVFDDVIPSGKLKIYKRPYPFRALPRSGMSDNLARLGGIKPVVPRVRANEPLRNELIHFIECVRKRKTPLTDVVFGAEVADLVAAIKKEIS